MDKLRIWTGLSCDVSLLWWRSENVWWSTYLIVSLLPDVTVKEHQSLHITWWVSGKIEILPRPWHVRWIKFAPVRAVLSEAIKLYPDDDEANSKEVDSIDCSNLRPFRNGKPPVHEQPTWSVPPKKHWLFFLSRMFPFCPKKPTWTGSMPVIQACFVARFFSCQFLQTPAIVGVLHFSISRKVPCCQSPIVEEFVDLFRTDTYAHP